MCKAYYRQLEAVPPTDTEHVTYLRRKLELLVFQSSRREEVCVPQALAALCTSFAACLVDELETAKKGSSGGGGGSSSSALEQWESLGFLVGWESLLSTYGKEYHMLGDKHGAFFAATLCLCDALEYTARRLDRLPPSW